MSICKSIQDSSDTVSLSSFQDQPYRTFHIRPQDGAVCKISIDTDNPDLTEYPVGREFDFTIGESESSLGDKIEDKLWTLKAGEKGKVFVKQENGAEGNKDSCFALTVTLCRLENCMPSYQLNNEDKFERAKIHKERGVKLFKDGKNEYAFRSFSRALKLLISMLPRDKLPEMISGEYDTLRVQCYSNIAACQMKEGNFDFVVANSTKVLGIEPNNVKCIYRRAKAYFNLKKYELCKNDVRKGLHVEPNSKTLCDLNKSLHDMKVA